MQSLDILFTGQDRVETTRREVAPPGPGQVLIRARKSFISSGTECICLGRLFEPGSHWDDWVHYPFDPGYSLVGEVVQVGEGVAGLVPGMRVTADTSHRQYALVSAEQDVFPIPDNVSDEDAAWFNISITVQNAVRRSEPVMGEVAVVVGLGLLGQLAVQYLRLVGAREVIAVDPAPTRLSMAEKHGATVALNMGVEQARDEIYRLTDGTGADVVYDVTGSAVVFSSALGLLRRFGRLIILGDTGAPSTQHITRDVITKGLRIIGTHANNPPRVATEHAPWSRGRMAALFFAYLARGDMRLGDLVTHRYSPEDAPAAYAMLRGDRSEAMAVIFDWNEVAG